MQYIYSFALLALTAAAAPSQLSKRQTGTCLRYDQAQDIAVAFIDTTSGKGAFNAQICDELLAADFSDTSSSVASVGNSGKAGPIPLGGPTFPSKEIFCGANSAQAPTAQTLLDLYFTCDTVIYRSEFSGLSPQIPISITILETQPAVNETRFPFQVKQAYNEFNSAAFITDLGGTCGGNPPPRKRSA